MKKKQQKMKKTFTEKPEQAEESSKQSKIDAKFEMLQKSKEDVGASKKKKLKKEMKAQEE
jgi:hypothetical protein